MLETKKWLPRPTDGIRVTKEASTLIRDVDVLPAILRHLAGDKGSITELEESSRGAQRRNRTAAISKFYSKDSTPFYVISEGSNTLVTLNLEQGA